MPKSSARSARRRPLPPNNPGAVQPPVPARALVALALVAALVVSVAPPVAAQDVEVPDSAEPVVPVPEGSAGVSRWDVTIASSGRMVGARSGSGGVTDSSAVPLGGDLTRLHVKFRESAGVRWTSAGLTSLGPELDLQEVLAGSPGSAVEPLFGRRGSELAEEKSAAEAISGDRLPDLATWFLFTAASPVEGAVLLDRLEGLAAVEMVQPEPALAATAPVEEERQGYLNGSPSGVGAEWAWSRPGGTGSRVVVAVIDSGFDTDHPDVDRASAPGVAIAHEPAWDSHHGLQVLGILVGDDDGAGVRGIASGAGIRTVNSGTTSGQVANAISLASAALGAGDVISISQGICAIPQCADDVVLPLVYSSSARDALRVATAKGIITVVSGGNGGASLDNYASRLGADAPDTIVVGAGNPAAGACSAAGSPARGRVAFSNYGSRIDLQGWGACVRTAAQGGGYRWWGFTSAATPIVAGSAALVSSLAEESRGINLTGDQVRVLLRETGSLQVTAGARGGNIGPLPNVRAAIAGLEGVPENDMWSRAREINDLPFSATVESRWAGVEVGEPAVLCGGMSHSVWYRFRPSEDMRVTFDTVGSDHDTVVGLWRRSGGGLLRVSCDDDISAVDTRSSLTRRLEAGGDYYIQVGGASGRSGILRLNVSSPAMPDVGCDIDNDDRGDLVSGSPREDVDGRNNAGQALVHFGRRNGRPRKVTTITQEWPGVSGGSERGDGFAAAVTCGDFDGDGYDDVAAGGPGEGVDGLSDVGAVRVFPGSRRGVAESGAVTFTQGTRGIRSKNEVDDNFGRTLAVGDLNGDGYEDLAIGSVGEAIGAKAGSGAVHVVYGSSGGLDLTTGRLLTGNTAGLPNRAEQGDAFGAALAIDDFDGDGFDDLAIGAPGEGLRGARDAGAVYILPGSLTGVTANGSQALHQRIRGIGGEPEAGDAFGSALAAGDVNGDGRADLLVGVPGETIAGSIEAGRVHEIMGGPGGLDPRQSRSLHQDVDGVAGRVESGDRFGAALAVADINGDGFADALVGAPGEGVGGAARAGQVHVFDGSSTGLATVGDQVVHQGKPGVRGAPEEGDLLGSSLTIIDLDGDGRRDLVAGVPGEDAGTTADTGSIVLVPGGRKGVRIADATRLSQIAPRAGDNAPGDQFGLALAGP